MYVNSIKRCFQTHCLQQYAKQVPNNLKGKSKSSQEWLTRQLADPYVEKAKIMNYRCRSAFKLLEINEKYKILKPGDVVVDCGAAPGSWTQVAVEFTNSHGGNEKQPRGTVVSMDLQYFHEVKGAQIFGGMDITKPASQLLLKQTLAGRGVNCVLSDMAPNATGVRIIDQECIMNLCYSALQFAVNVTKKGGTLVVKIWDNGDVHKLEKQMLHFYEKVKRVKPNSSRSVSSEHFLVARYFKGMDDIMKNDQEDRKV